MWGSDVYNFPQRSKLHRKILQYNMRRADVLLSTSRVMRDEIRKYTDKEIEVTPFGVDTDQFAPANDKVRDEVIRVGTIKPIREKYGIIHIIEAAEILCRTEDPARYRFYLVGAGDLD